MPDKELIINANPTKDFFINILTKDIELTRAVVDLVDNCADGALRMRPKRNFRGLWVQVEAKPDRFCISDNCGGIKADLARDYVFRFGRAEGMPSTPHSVGQFGVGMKRALFKLGSKFRVESASETSRFVVDADVNKWITEPKWEFEFEKLGENLPEIPVAERGTNIAVTELHDNVTEFFKLENFVNRLRSDIRQAHQETIKSGLSISLNGVPLESHPLELLASGELKPAYLEKDLSQNGSSGVKVRIYAGISASDPDAAGWYVYCNGRMVVGADQSVTTGWGDGIPQYHNQYARFRGFSYFDSDNAGLLPWNTTKTGVDTDSPIFRAVRLSMITLMRPVITFLNKLDNEKKEMGDSKPLETAIVNSKPVPIAEVQTSSTFSAPEPTPQPPQPRLNRIQYNRPEKQIEVVKKTLKVSTLREVGEGTFDYFYKQECEE